MSRTEEKKYRGRCLCGAISYEVIGEPVVVGHCYCINCRRATGAGHSSGAMFPESSYVIHGKLQEYSFDTRGTMDTRLFCGTCGSQLMGKNSALPGMLSLALGSLDDPDALLPSVAIYTGQKPTWDGVDPQVRHFEGSAAGLLPLPKPHGED